jgi:hypothetical protein
MVENRAPKNIFGRKRDELTVEWRRLHSEELSVQLIKYYSGYQMKNEMGGACGKNERQKRCLQGFGGET